MHNSSGEGMSYGAAKIRVGIVSLFMFTPEHFHVSNLVNRFTIPNAH